MERTGTGRRTISLIVALIMTLSLVVAGASIADAGSSMTATAKIKAEDGAIVRSKASSAGKEVMTLSQDAEVTVTSEVFTTKKSYAAKNRWYYVEAEGKKGYIRSDLLKDLSYETVTKQTTDPLNYRRGAGVKMKRVGTFSKKAKIKVCLKAKAKGGHTWYKVKKDSKYYYVDSSYVKAVSSSGSKAAKVATAAVDTSKPQNKKVKTLNATSYASGTKNDITYTNITYPFKVGEGCPFVLDGTLSSEIPFKSCAVYILDSKGNVVQSKTKKVKDQATVFDISTVDAKITFGSLSKGSYKYKITATTDGEEKDVCSFDFTIVKINGPSDLAAKGLELAWPAGTKAKKYSYPKGTSTAAFKAAFDYAHPSHKKWGPATGKGASCDVFVSVVCRSCGYDRDMPAGLRAQWKYLPKSKKWKKINYHFKESELRSGDVITYKRTNGQGHILLYVKKNGKGYLCEAAYRSKYGMLNSSLKKILKPAKNVKTFSVYRAVK